MSITSTLTTIGAAGAGGGLSYWANEIAFSGDTVFYQNKIHYSPDLVAFTLSNTTSGGGSLNTGCIITLDQDGILQDQRRFYTSQNSYGGGFYPLDLLYDNDTSAWYSGWYYSGYNYVGRHSSSPTGGFSWIQSLGHTGGMTETPDLYSIDSSNLGARFSAGSGPTRLKISKSNGAQQVYKQYASPQNNSQSHNFSEGISTGFVVSQKSWSSKQVATIVPVSIDPNNDSSGSSKNGSFVYAQNSYDGELYSSETYISGVDSGGNFVGTMGYRGNNIYSLNPSALSLRYYKSVGSTPVSFCYAPIEGVLWMLDSDGRICKLDTSGQPVGGIKYRTSFSGQANTPDWQVSDLKIDEENNVAYITTIGTSMKNRIIIKRPLDSSLDGTYGIYTLSTQTGQTHNDIYVAPFGTQAFRANHSSYVTTLSNTQVGYFTSSSYESRLSHTKTDIG